MIDELKEEYEYLDGISFSGGDPLEQADKFIYIAKAAKQLGLSI
ncbi:hypothetical protein FACS189496_2800 [Bacilli bacterium]|nr:hypothetical protein FACS189496_2800 [Bacilli bacterium]